MFKQMFLKVLWRDTYLKSNLVNKSFHYEQKYVLHNYLMWSLYVILVLPTNL